MTRYEIALSLLLVNAVFGAWDTLWYHEYKARLVANLPTTRTELKLHVVRDVVYVGVYGALGLGKPAGVFAGLLLLGLAIEIAATLTDFVVEDRDRPSLGGIAAGERILHTIMAIVYGAMLASLLPAAFEWLGEPTAISSEGSAWLRFGALFAAAGITATGARDLGALLGYDPLSRWLPAKPIG